MKPSICILKTDGTNCEQETAYACMKAGALPHVVHLSQLKHKSISLHEFDMLIIPGGFSYGDDIASGRVFALELQTNLQEQLMRFIEQKKLIMGICNGFQVLVQLGLLPFTTFGTRHVSLSHNNSLRFECRWTKLLIEKSTCAFTQELVGHEITLPVAHGEGNFYTDPETLRRLEQQRLVVLRYGQNKCWAQTYPENPNGSLHSIAGICNPEGTIFGLMPHPERYTEYYHLPTWRRIKIQKPHGILFFEQAINYMR